MAASLILFETNKILNLNLFKTSIQKCFKSTTSIQKIIQEENLGASVQLKGWVKSLRKQKEITFIHLNDGESSHQIQVILPTNQISGELTVNSSVTINGNIVKSPGSKQSVEIQGNNLQVLSSCKVTEGFPFEPRKIYPLDFLRGFPHLKPKTRIGSSVYRLSSLVNVSLHNSLTELGYCHVYTPVLTTNNCEGGSEVFIARPEDDKLCREMNETKKPEEAFFDQKVFLTVSAQLHLEAMTSGLSKVYTLSPTFRAENSRSRRHLAEFRMLEAEIAFCETLQPLLEIMESLVKNCSQNLLERGGGDIEVMEKFTNQKITEHLENVLKTNFATLPYCEAMKMLQKHKEGFKNEPVDGEDLASEHEAFIVEHVGCPTFITDWPAAIKPFYMRVKEDNPQYVESVDLLVGGVGELCGGSLREYRYQLLKSRIDHMKPSNSLDWYLDLRRFGGSPTGGFGMGVERLLLYLLKMPNIRDIVPFPRWPHHCPM